MYCAYVCTALCKPQCGAHKGKPEPSHKQVHAHYVSIPLVLHGTAGQQCLSMSWQHNCSCHALCTFWESGGKRIHQ